MGTLLFCILESWRLKVYLGLCQLKYMITLHMSFTRDLCNDSFKCNWNIVIC